MGRGDGGGVAGWPELRRRLLAAAVVVQVLAATTASDSAPDAVGGWRAAEVDCTACHVPDPLFSHPAGVLPSMEVPAHLPLPGGRIACVTCHDGGHALAHSATPRDERYWPVLRGEVGSEVYGGVRGAHGDLCRACHDGGVGGRHRSVGRGMGPSRAGGEFGGGRGGGVGGSGGPHGAALGRAHLRWRDGGRRAGGEWIEGALDRESAECMSCHDGALAMGAAYATLPAGGFMNRRRTASSILGEGHPIGVEHPHGRSASLRSAAELDDRIRLFDGRIGCGTCHSPYSAHPHLLVMSNDRSALCLGCHDF